MNQYNKLNTILGLALFLISSIVYLITMEPTVSFWDCGEYIATAYKLQVGHPPGAPTFQLIGRFFSLFAFGDTSKVALMLNALSALSSGLTIMFLFWTITHFSRRLLSDPTAKTSMLVIFGSGIVGALAYTFSDSFWFSASEGEVYAMSSLFTAMTFWAILKWEETANSQHSYRWLILIAYLIGLSIGVHLLNLLAIPAITLVYYFKKNENPGWKGILLVLLLSFAILAFIMYGIIPEIVTLFASTELLFVNTFGLPFNTGTVFFGLIIIALLTLGIMHTERKEGPFKKILITLGLVLVLLFLAVSSSVMNFMLRLIIAAAIVGMIYYWRERKVIMNTILLSLTFILIGYSSFFLLIIRSNADPPIDENNPEDAIALLAYLNREQYGTYPLIYGHYYNAPVIERGNGTPVYRKDFTKGKYVISDPREGIVPEFDPDYETIFPRMWNSQEKRYIDDYKKWAGIIGDPENRHIPTFGENLRYFWKYQINHMYFRYFFWNFAGRQNDAQGMYNDVLNGNWKSGLGILDDGRLGPQHNIPDSLASKANNKFFLLPFLFGIIGLLFQFNKRKKDGLIVLALMFMTGLAIVIFLNQHSPQPRERDYAFAASFYAFAIWIGFSVIAVREILAKKMNPRTSAILSTVIILLLVPVIMAVGGWNDHDRSGRYNALQMATNYLESCEEDAILFTNGDNDTFPLWYAQEVEGIRTDVRVVNLSLLQTDWYIDQMKRKAYDSDPVPFSLTPELYRNGRRDYTYLIEQESVQGFIEIKELFDIIHTDESRLQFNTENGPVDIFPTKSFKISVDPATVIKNGVVSPEEADKIVDIKWKINRSGLTKNYLMMLDLLAHNNWERPVYYATTTGAEAYLGLEEYFQLEGLTYRLVPIRSPKQDGLVARINSAVMYENLINYFEFDVSDPKLFVSNDVDRMSVSLRNCFARCASALTSAGKHDEAVEIADKCLAMIPNESIPYNYFSAALAESYYQANEQEKGNEIMKTMLNIQNERLEYYLSFPQDKKSSVVFENRQALAILYACKEMLDTYGQPELSKEAGDLIEFYYAMQMGN